VTGELTATGSTVPFGDAQSIAVVQPH
jgi:hypothetical protein